METLERDPEEVAATYPCDAYAPSSRIRLRAQSASPPAGGGLPLGVPDQGVAPYSYDWVDNRGRRSPRTLTPGAQPLEGGQDILGFPRKQPLTLLSLTETTAQEATSA